MNDKNQEIPAISGKKAKRPRIYVDHNYTDRSQDHLHHDESSNHNIHQNMDDQNQAASMMKNDGAHIATIIAALQAKSIKSLPFPLKLYLLVECLSPPITTTSTAYNYKETNVTNMVSVTADYHNNNVAPNASGKTYQGSNEHQNKEGGQSDYYSNNKNVTSSINQQFGYNSAHHAIISWRDHGRAFRVNSSMQFVSLYDYYLFC